MADKVISVKIKMSGQGETFDWNVNPEHNVDQVIDSLLQAKTELVKDNTTLVRKGRILKKDQVVKDIGVAEGETLHLVNKADKEDNKEDTNTQGEGQMPNFPGMGMPGMGMPGMGMPGMGMPGMGMGMPDMGMMGGAGGSPFGDMGGFNPEMIANMLNNPMVKSMMDDLFSDPAKLQSMLDSNPMLSQMAEGNEEIQDMIRNPDKIKEAMSGEKFDETIKSMTGNMQNMSAGSGQPGVGPDGSTGAPQQMPQFPGMMGMPGMQGMTPPPGFENMMAGIDQDQIKKMMEGFNLSPPTQGPSSDKSYEGMSQEALKTEFKAALEQMEGMGFSDEAENIELLKETKGDAQAAIEKAMEKLD